MSATCVRIVLEHWLEVTSFLEKPSTDLEFGVRNGTECWKGAKISLPVIVGSQGTVESPTCFCRL